MEKSFGNLLVNYCNVDIVRGSYIVLQNVDFKVYANQIVYVVGKVGSGKSSLIGTLYGEIPVAGGQARVLDFDLQTIRHKQIPMLRRRIGVVFQDFRLLPDRSVYDNLDFVLRATTRKNDSERKQRIEEVLAVVEMSTKGYKMPFELSGGEQQRVVIARALLNDPEIILADEPTGNLDPETGQAIFELLNRIAGEGKGVVLSTHNHSLIDRFPGQVYLCEDKHLCKLP